MADKYIYVKLTKEWGGFKVGDIVRFGWNKGMGRITANGGVEVKKQRAINDPPEELEPAVAELKIEATPKAETATMEPTEQAGVEQAVVTPKRARKPKE